MSSALSVCHINLARGFRGGERQTELLIQNLALLGVKQCLVIRDHSPLYEHLKDTPNLEIIKLRKVLDLRFNGHLKVGSRFDFLQAHEARATHWDFLHHLIYKTPFVTTRRVPESVRDNTFNRQIYSKASAVVAISNAIAHTLEQQFKRPIETIPSACAHFLVDKEKAQAIKLKFKDNFVIGHIGALVDRHKGQSVILKAVASLVDKIPNLKVVFLGSGSDEALLKEQASKLNLEDKVVFTGFVNNVVDYIGSFDVFAYPSNYEGLGSVLLDVMEQKVPIIATNVDGIPDLIKDGKTGILIEKQDDRALAQGILKLKEDQDFKVKLIENAFLLAKDLSPENMAKAYLKLYQKLKP